MTEEIPYSGGNTQDMSVKYLDEGNKLLEAVGHSMGQGKYTTHTYFWAENSNSFYTIVRLL